MVARKHFWVQLRKDLQTSVISCLEEKKKRVEDLTNKKKVK